MGHLAASAIIDRGLKKAGRTDLSSEALGWLNTWLTEKYGAWPWPFLHRRAAGVALGAGVAEVLVGAGSGIGQGIQRIFDPLWVYTTDRRVMGRVRVTTGVDTPVDWAEQPNGVLPAALPIFLGQTSTTGIPTHVVQRPIGGGQVALYPYPVPDRAVELAFEYLWRPEHVGTNDIPVYPEDETMEWLIEAHALQWSNRKDEAEAMFEKVAARSINDRCAHGSATGINDRVTLDSSVFR